jgi:catechol 2,3-dioxygenase-like lactoylglutathione lyase family enzyme
VVNETSESLRSVIRIAIAVLCFGAVVLIVLIVSGTGVDETTGKTFGTAVAVAFFSLTGVAGSNLGRQRPDLAVFGLGTLVISAIAFLVMTATIWSGSFLGDDWKPAVYTGVIAFGCGHASVLLAGSDAGDSDEIRLVRAGTLLALLLLVGATVGETSSRSPQHAAVKLIGVLAVIYVLGTIVLGLLRRSAPHVEPTASTTAAAGLRGLHLDHLVIGISDRAAASSFYGNVLGAEIVAMPEEGFAFRVGHQLLKVHDPGNSAEPLARNPVGLGNSDLCFVWPEPIQSAVAHLQRLGIEIVAGPVVRIGATGPGQSVYCRDPDGSLIELISYA